MSIRRGATSEKPPSGDWASTTSCTHLVKNEATSRFPVAVRTKIWASPIHPSRSSRCGQSVGMLKKLPRWPQSMLDTSWLTIGLSHSNVPALGVSECRTQPVTASAGGVPG